MNDLLLTLFNIDILLHLNIYDFDEFTTKINSNYKTELVNIIIPMYVVIKLTLNHILGGEKNVTSSSSSLS